jgi:hypothetical protein
MATWTDNRLDLGALGSANVTPSGVSRSHFWSWSISVTSNDYDSEKAARRAAVAWMRRALRSAEKRLEVGK